MKLQFLGTSDGAPTKERNVTSLAVGFEQRSDWYMFDCGEATQHQLQHSVFNLSKLSKFFITHMHGDHIFGLPGLLSSRSMVAAASSMITIFGPIGIREFVETSLRLSASHLSYPIEFVEFSKAGIIYEDVNEKVQTIRLSHDVPSFAYCLTEADRPGTFDVDKAMAAGVPSGPLLGKLAGGEQIELDNGTLLNGKDFVGPTRAGRTIIIGGDNDKPELLKPFLNKADLLVHESTMIDSVRATMSYQARHSTAADVAKAAQAGGLKNLILTHISARFGTDPAGLTVKAIRKEAKAHYDGNLFLARDLDVFELSRDGELGRI